jgi:predicted ester cyclase
MESRPWLAEGGFMTDTDDNKKIVTSFIDRLFSQGDLTAVDDHLSEDFVNHDPPFGASADREGMRAAGTAFRAAFPDWHSELHLLIAEDDLVAEVFTASGTHRGEMMGSRPPDEKYRSGGSTCSGFATAASPSDGAASTTSGSSSSSASLPPSGGEARSRPAS